MGRILGCRHCASFGPGFRFRQGDSLKLSRGLLLYEMNITTYHLWNRTLRLHGPQLGQLQSEVLVLPLPVGLHPSPLWECRYPSPGGAPSSHLSSSLGASRDG